jgi:rhodanese-related sulfurtransferase
MTTDPRSLSTTFPRVVRDAVLIVVGASAIGLAANSLRPRGSIPFVQTKPYDIVVPCPEPVGEAAPMKSNDPRVLESTSLVIDARSKSDYVAAHVPSALNVPFDWLGPPVANETAEVAQRVARSQARLVIVYGDGDDPDSGREWARLLSGGGIKNVYYIEGGARALEAQMTATGGVP